MSMSQTSGGSAGVIIPLHRDVILDTASGSKSPSGVTDGATEGPCDLLEQLTLFEEEPYR
jgi:hypothetical protein